MPSIKPLLEASAKRSFLIGTAMAGGLGMTASGLQAAPEQPAIAAPQIEVSPDRLPGCGLEGRGAQRFVVDRAGAGTRTMQICDTEPRGDPAATAQALSLAIDAAAAQPFRLTTDPATADIIGLRLRRDRTEMDSRKDPDTRTRELLEIDAAIKQLEGGA
ncbi:MAG TPA: hypothetical protein VEW26_12945 [Allosphingosinicella sp.]|nr:hypothetical protein [Allosphingosinicella sp.]